MSGVLLYKQMQSFNSFFVKMRIEKAGLNGPAFVESTIFRMNMLLF